MDSKWPRELKELVEACWHAEPNNRPDAAHAVKVLSGLIQKMDGHTGTSGSGVAGQLPSNQL